MAPPPQPGTQPNPTGQMLNTVGMLVLMGVIFYFLLIRPQQKKAKQHEAMLKTLRNGDKVVTSGGVIGVVVGFKENSNSISIRSADTKIEVLKSAITEIKERSSDTTASA